MNVKLVGDTYKHLVIELQPQEEFFSETGAFVYCEEGISRQKVWQQSIWGAMMSGESMFVCKYSNTSNVPLKLVLKGQYNSMSYVKIKYGDVFMVRCGGYVASNRMVKIGNKLSFKTWSSGMGLNFQKIEGNSTVFIDDTQYSQCKELKEGETIVVDENHVNALLNIGRGQLHPDVSIDNLLKGEGFSVLRITGPGSVYMSFLPLPSSTSRSPIGCIIPTLILAFYIWCIVYTLH